MPYMLLLAMTLVLAIRSADDVLLASDRAVTDGFFKHTAMESKWQHQNGYWIGHAGVDAYSVRAGPPPNPKGEDIDWRATIEHHYVSKFLPNHKDGADGWPEVSLMLVRDGHIYTVDEAGQCLEHREAAAIGSGAEVAYGALFATRATDPWDRAELALAAASKYCVGVGPPYDFIWASQEPVEAD